MSAVLNTGRLAAILGPVRHNPSTVVVLAGRPSEPALAAVGRSLNVVLVRPQEQAAAADSQPGGAGTVEAAAAALRRAAGISAPYVLVAADPLGPTAESWREMWSITPGSGGRDEFELRAAQALAAWRSRQFELPDYYLVLADQPAAGGDAGPAPDFHLGPLRSVRPRRVAVAAGSEPAQQAAALLAELGTLRHGPWWPSLEEIFGAARAFYPGALAESPSAGRGTLLG
jgi:hypothetical protein